MAGKVDQELLQLSEKRSIPPAWESWPPKLLEKIQTAVQMVDAGHRVTQGAVVKWAKLHCNLAITSYQINSYLRRGLGRQSWASK